MSEFKREERYIVIKRKHLSDDAILAVEALADAFGEVYDCAVVENPWPEYEIVWKMIEDRVAAENALPKV